VLDKELEETVARINRVRAELSVVMRHRASAYVPSEFAPVSRDLSERQRSLLMVYSTVLSDKSLGEFREVLSNPGPTEEEFEALPPEADDAAIDDLVARMLPVLRSAREGNPWSKAPTADAPRGAKHAEHTMAEAIVQLYNPAQLRVLKRLNDLLQDEAADASDGACR